MAYKILTSILLFCSFTCVNANVSTSTEMAPLRFLWSGSSLALETEIESKFQTALAKELGRTATFAKLSRKRMEFSDIQIQIDLVCFANPAWLGDSAQYYEWTKAPLMNIEYIFVGSKTTPLVTDFKDIKGKKIGVIYAYRYQNLDQYFDTHFAIREDAPSLESSLEKQLLNRSDYTVVRRLIFQHLKKRSTKYANLVASPLLISKESVYCGRVKQSKIMQKDVELAIDKLIKRGELAKIIADY